MSIGYGFVDLFFLIPLRVVSRFAGNCHPEPFGMLKVAMAAFATAVYKTGALKV